MDAGQVVPWIIAALSPILSYVVASRQFKLQQRSQIFDAFTDAGESYSKLVKDLREQVDFLRREHELDREEWQKERDRLVNRVASLERAIRKLKGQVNGG